MRTGSDGPRRRSGIALAVAAIAAALLLGPRAVPAGADLTDDVMAVNLMGPALVRVQAAWATPGGPETATCTGVLVHADGYLVTAADCVERAGGTLEGPVTVTVGEGTDDHAPRPARVLGVARSDALALLKVAGRHLPAVRLATAMPTKAVPAVVGGFRTVTATVTDAEGGTYFDASLVVRPADKGAPPAYALSRAVEDGMLGGPVSEFGGTVVGVAVAVVGTGPEATTLLAAAPRVLALLARHRVTNDLGPAGRAYEEGVHRVRELDWEPAAEALGKALVLNPHLVVAGHLHQLALEAPDYDEDDEGGLPVALIVGLAALVVAATIGAVAAVRRRRRRASALAGTESS